MSESMDLFRSREDYQKHFDANQYYERHYRNVEGFLVNILPTLHDIFSSGDHTGVKLLEFGSGPCIYSVLIASRVFSDIYMSDWCDSNRKALDSWKGNNPDAHDWTSILDYISKLEGITKNELENRTRSAIKGVLPCDALAEEVLPPGYNEFDCIMSFCCLETACPDVESYKASVSKLAALLKPGGTIVLFTYLGDEWYRFGDAIFKSLSLTKTDINEALAEAGFADIKVVLDHHNTEEEKAAINDNYVANGYVILTAKLPEITQ